MFSNKKYGLSDSLIKAVEEATKTHTVPKTEREKRLAALAHPKDKITHKDVMVGRGVIAKEEADGSDYPFYKRPAKSQDYIGNRSITSKLHNLHKKHNFSGVTFFAAGLDREGDAPAGVNVKHNSPAHDHPEFKKHLSKLTKFNEEVEQIDEIGDTPKGREMLVNYIDKSARRIGVHSRQAANFKDTASNPTSSPAQKLAAKELGAKQQHKSNMRFKGVQAASSRLAKEEVEQVNELKKSTLQSYAGKVIDKTRTMPQGAKKQKHLTGLEKALERMKNEEKDTPGNSYQHQCAVHVKHSKLGEGKTLFSQHAEPDEDGSISWYDVMFEHGIEKYVPTSELEILFSESHMNHSKKKMKEEYEVNEAGGYSPNKHPQTKDYGRGEDEDEEEEDDDEPPFKPDAKKKMAVAGKRGYGPSAAKHLAKTGMKANEEVELDEIYDFPEPKSLIGKAAMHTIGAVAVGALVLHQAFPSKERRPPLDHNIDKAYDNNDHKLYHSLQAHKHSLLAKHYTKQAEHVTNSPDSYYKRDGQKGKKGEMRPSAKANLANAQMSAEHHAKKSKDYAEKEKSGAKIDKSIY